MEGVLVDDREAVKRLLAGTEALFLDFDGPVCSVFAGLPAAIVADQLREVLAEGGHTELPSTIEESEDPFDVFKHAATLGDEEARYVEAALQAHEVEAVRTAESTPSSHELIRRWSAAGRNLAIVSNNSAKAIYAYLDFHRLTPFVSFVSARTEAVPELLKPSSHLVEGARVALHCEAERCSLVGDSTADMDAAAGIGVAAVGFANKPHKVQALAVKANLIVTNMSILVAVQQ